MSSRVAEQQAVLEVPAERTALVAAGPGTGKTFTLLARAQTLTTRDGLEAARILVLSFTRAVVRELRRRDREQGEPARILPETFDSFASRLLRECSHDEAWLTAGFDGRIEAATRLIGSGRAEQTLARVHHILVDEVQDLVGVRAVFVQALLTAHDDGWTAFGDPAQAIYDHERCEADGDVALLEWLEQRADSVLHLEEDHRATGAHAGRVRALRQTILADADEGAAASWDAYFELSSMGRIDDLPSWLANGRIGSFALLCRDNATALQASSLLHDASIQHGVRRGTADRPVAGWVAAVIRDATSITRASCLSRVEELQAIGFPGGPDGERAWQLLCRMDPRSRGGAIRVSEVASRISVGRVPWELLDEPDHEIVISSIHRAKGLEFDWCATVRWTPSEDCPALDGRVLFVALSRARNDGFQIERGGRQRWFRRGDAQERFVKLGREDWQTFGMEIRGGDVHAHDPGGVEPVTFDARHLQLRLIRDVRPGDPVELVYRGELQVERTVVPCYEVRHSSGVIGLTGDRLGRALATRLRRRRPARMTGVRIDDLETVKGSADVGDAAGLGRSGLWLRPRLVGLGDFDWSEQ